MDLGETMKTQTARDINGRLIVWFGDTGEDDYATRHVYIGGEFIRVKTKPRPWEKSLMKGQT